MKTDISLPLVFIGLPLIAWALFLFTSCTVTVSPDGSKSATVDAPTILRALEVIAEK
jgi:hypothetical protein